MDYTDYIWQPGYALAPVACCRGDVSVRAATLLPAYALRTGKLL